MFELAADKLAQDIKAVPYSLDDFCKFGDEVLELPFPFVGKIPWPRFTMVSHRNGEFEERKSPADDTTAEAGQGKGSKTGRFRYYGREAFKVIYDDAMSLRIHQARQSTISTEP